MANNILLRQKYHQYKSFSPAGVYLGLIQNIKETFNYNQLIGTSFAQIQFTVEQSADVASQTATPITDEQGNPITDESGNPILIERVADIVGSNNSNALIANNNLIQVWEYSNYYPNGILKFSGYISKWKTTFGGSDDILVTCISNGQDLSQYLVQGAPTVDQSQLLTDQQFTYNSGVSQFLCQRVIMTASTLSQVTLRLAAVANNNPNVTVSIFYGQQFILLLSRWLAVAAPDASFTLPVTSTSPTNYNFIFNNLALNGNQAILIAIYCTDPLGVKVSYQDTAPYGGLGICTGITGTFDLYFDTYYPSSTVSSAYINDDPSYVMTNLMTNYISQGGLITVPVAGYNNTNTLTTYTFKAQTVLQAIQTTVGLAPSTWYWYVDPATGVLNFAKQDTTADITIIKNRHINEIDIEATKETIINNVYFAGGDDGTGQSHNILVQVTGAKGSNRTGMAQLSDNRVNSTNGGVTTARLIAQNYLNTNSAETYISNVTIQDQTIDINLFKLGQTVGFAGFGNFVDNLLLQVVGLNYQSDQVVLQLGSLPKRTSKSFADAEAALAYLQTVAVNTTPS